jgi:hypothetical protein
MTNDPTTPETLPEAIERAVMVGDLADLSSAQRAEYYTAVCRSLGLNPLTKPFEFLTLNGKLRLYALRDCADQLRRLHGISIYITNRERMGDIYIVTARAKDRTGREDESTGAVPLGNLKGDALANALMKAETKSKRRVTLSIAGLGWLDETELETSPRHHITTDDVVPLPAGEEISQGPAVMRPTADEITTLIDTARAANVSLEDFGHDMRRLMKLPESKKVTKKFLRETMTMAQYNTARAHYGEKLRVILEGDVPDFAPHKEATNGTATPPTTVSAEESTTAQVTEDNATVPFGGSSSVPAPAPDADATREKLRAEAIGWGIKASEVDHILQHHPVDKARTLLSRARRPVGATLTESAAD